MYWGKALNTKGHLGIEFETKVNRIFIEFLHSVIGNSSLVNDLLAGHSVTGLRIKLGLLYQGDPGPMEDSKFSDLVAR